MEKKVVYSVCVPDEYPAGIYGFTDKISVIVHSGDPGGDPGDFENFFLSALKEWYDMGRVSIEHVVNSPDCQFKDLPVGSSFDFIDDRAVGYNSFFLRCRKLSARKYQDSSGTVHRVGSVQCNVFHVEK